MEQVTRAWAMRTSREAEKHRQFIYTELHAGRLRQGWGYLPEQDLRSVRDRIADPAAGWAALTTDEKWAWGHWRMLGEAATNPDDTMKDGDVVLIPNVPSDGTFTLCRLVGPYEYQIDNHLNDFGHVRPVQVLTPDGVAFTNNLVLSDLRRSLRCRSRLWWLGSHGNSLGAVLAEAASGSGELLRQGSDHSKRAQNRVAGELRGSLDSLAARIAPPLREALQAAEWETVLRDALMPLMRDVEVRHTGGPAEAGADLEIHFPNPFSPAEPWIVAVQVKDYDGEIASHVSGQIEQAITARQGLDAPGTGKLVAVVLASTRAAPSKELLDDIARLTERHHVPISCVHGSDLMRVFARGLLTGYRDLP